MKRWWKTALSACLVASLVLVFALLVRPKLSWEMKDSFRSGLVLFFDDVELSAGRHYRLSFDERLPLMQRDPRGVARYELYLEPLAEVTVDRSTDLTHSDLVGTAEMEVDCKYDGTQVTRCSHDSSGHIDFTVANDGRYRVRIANNGNRTAGFVRMSLNRILLDWWIPLVLLVLAVASTWLLWRRSDPGTRAWVTKVALRPWKWRSS